MDEDIGTGIDDARAEEDDGTEDVSGDEGGRLGAGVAIGDRVGVALVLDIMGAMVAEYVGK